MYLLPLTIAEAAPASTPQQSPFGMFGMMAIIFAIMYLVMIRPQRRREKERKAMIANLKSGCRVLLTSGIIGEVITVKENTLIVRIAENAKVEVVRGAISQLLDKGEAPADLPAN